MQIVVDGSVVDESSYYSRDRSSYYSRDTQIVVDGSVVDGSSYYSRDMQKVVEGSVVDGSIHLLLIHLLFERHTKRDNDEPSRSAFLRSRLLEIINLFCRI